MQNDCLEILLPYAPLTPIMCSTLTLLRHEYNDLHCPEAPWEHSIFFVYLYNLSTHLLNK